MRQLFPIQTQYHSLTTHVLAKIPWNMIEPHEEQAQINHGQSLVHLADRAGLSACEAIAVLEDRLWTNMSDRDATEKLYDLFTQYQCNLNKRPYNRVPGNKGKRVSCLICGEDTSNKSEVCKACS